MPKIDAPTVAEHVARREAEIFDAATRLFAEQGVADTNIGQIADAVGVARSAVYRYFPSKEQILIASFERRIPALIKAAEAAVAEASTPTDRLEAWLSFQIDLAVDPTHEIGRRLLSELSRLPAEYQDAISVGNDRLNAPLRDLVAAVLCDANDPRSPELLTALMVGMLRAAASWAIQHDDAEALKGELVAAARRLLNIR